jgi:hypothetical protein
LAGITGKAWASVATDSAPACTATEERNMPLNSVNDVKHWRDRAVEMRALANTMKDDETRLIMNRLADDYDILADRAAARVGHDSNSPSPRPHTPI